MNGLIAMDIARRAALLIVGLLWLALAGCAALTGADPSGTLAEGAQTQAEEPDDPAAAMDAEADLGDDRAEAPPADSGSQPEPEALPAPDPAPDPVAASVAAPPGPEPPLLAEQRRVCARDGGTLRPRATGILACVRTTRDSGRACTASRQCEGDCLARSGTCAPMTPLYGCHEVLLAPNSRVTQCLD